MKNLKNSTTYLIIFTILLHLVFIDLYPVNFEYVFYEGHNFVKQNFNKEIASNFFKQQANTFFFTFTLSLISFLLPFLKPIYIGKFISMISYLLIGLSAINILNKLDKKSNLNNFRFLFLILLFFNPIIWIFGYRSTPDLISMGIGLYGFSIFYKYENEKRVYTLFDLLIPSFLLGFATTMKPIVGIYLIASICIMQFKYNYKFIKKIFLIGFIYSIIPIIYFYFTYINFNFTLFSPYYQDVLSVVDNLQRYISNFILYTSFLLIFILPIVCGRLLFLVKSFSTFSLIINFFLISLIFFVGKDYLDLSVEMSLGLFDKMIGKQYLRGIFSVLSYLFIFLVILEFKKFYLNKDRKNFNLLLVGILYLLIVSSSLASQRYLIAIVPLFYFIFKEYYKYKINFLFILIICIPVNIILLGNQYLTGSLSNKIINIIEKENMIDKVCAGTIGSHVSDYFSYEERLYENCVLKDFHIVDGISEKSLYSVKGDFLFLNKSYSVIKVR